jgi:hypothetical protein
LSRRLDRRRFLKNGAGGGLAGAVSFVGASIAAGASGDAIALDIEPVPFSSEDPAARHAGRLAYRGGIALAAEDRRFGGWSDLWLSPGGDQLVMISDRGSWLTARPRLDAGGAVTGLETVRIGALLDGSGRALRGVSADAEGLAPASDGGFYVSFERLHRIWHYPGDDAPLASAPRPLPPPPDLGRAPLNGGIEAIAALGDGRLVAIAEELRDARGDNVGWIGGAQGWASFAWAASGFRPTGAALSPDGDLLVLERRFAMLTFAARILRVPAAQLVGGARIVGEELGEWSAPFAIDNLEGVATRRGANGETLLYLVSDDNFQRLLQRTLLLCFTIEPA